MPLFLKLWKMFEKLNKRIQHQVNTAYWGESMEIKIVSEKQNPMLKRREVTFQTEHDQTGSTPSRLETRKAVAAKLKVDENMVFIKKCETRTGTHTAVGVGHIYDSIEQAKLIEPEYIVKRNIPEKPKEEVKEQNVQESGSPKEGSA